ncbi:tail fiber assembly protein [Enterobacter sp. P82]|uniref:tail fiber assembly protein n=1 Tax=Enterobacter sp. P82 TaxID=3123033 RepID=UPI00300D7D8F
MTTYYSATTNGFYPEIWKQSYELGGEWPADAVEVSEHWHDYLVKNQGSGKEISANEYGYPVLKDVQVDWNSKAEDQRQVLLSESYGEIDNWKIELQLGTITEDDRASLTEWMAYIKKLKAMDFVAVIDEYSFNSIDWPVKPSNE